VNAKKQSSDCVNKGGGVLRFRGKQKKTEAEKLKKKNGYKNEKRKKKNKSNV